MEAMKSVVITVMLSYKINSYSVECSLHYLVLFYQQLEQLQWVPHSLQDLTESLLNTSQVSNLGALAVSH